MIRRYLRVSLFVLLAGTSAPTHAAGSCDGGNRVETFPLSAVRLTDGPFKRAQELDMKYILALAPDRLLAPYLKEAGLEPKAENYPNWENTGLDGHIGGHYLSALAMMYASTGDSGIKARLDYVLGELRRCQDAAGDGYLCGVPGGRQMWNDIARGDIKADAFALNGKWVPLYNIHKTFAGLRDAWLHTGIEQAKQMLVRLTDWMDAIVAGLSDGQMQDMLRSEHGGLNEIFADVACITGDSRYLKLARRFSHNLVLDPLLRHEDRLTGMHANTQIPKVVGFKRIADAGGDAAWGDAAAWFWQTVTDNRTVTIGGNSVREHFHPADDFSSMVESEQGPETCNTYNMMRLTRMLYQTDPQTAYIDYYERALYNHILSTQNSEKGGFVYFTPMRPGHYRVYSQPQTSFWCCVGSSLEGNARHAEMIYGHKRDSLYVNLFVPSTLQWGDTRIEQQTAFPDEEQTTIIITPKKSKAKFVLKVRIPEWTKAEDMELRVNGEAQRAVSQGGYLVLDRKWKQGDRLTVSLPMHLRAVQMPDRSAYYSFLYGPIVLASDLGKERQDGLFADDSRGGHVAAGPQLPLQDMPAITGKPGDLLSCLHKSDGSQIAFTLSSVYPSRYDNMRLVPFYRLHECRYMVYWPVISAEELDKRVAALAAEEQERARLEAVTVDVVACGEQQPESDHFIEMQNTVSGSDNDRHWRVANAGGWFAYSMSVGEKQPAAVRVTMKAKDNESAVVAVDGDRIGTLKAGDGDGLTDIIVMLPEGFKAGKTVNVKVEADGQQPTPRIYEVRLVTAEALGDSRP